MLLRKKFTTKKIFSGCLECNELKEPIGIILNDAPMMAT